MKELEAYNIYKGIKLHFTCDYDYIKYRGKFKEDSTFKRFFFLFQKITKKYEKEEFEHYVIANILVNDKLYCTALNAPDADAVYLEYKKLHQSLGYEFETSVKSLLNKYEDNLPSLFSCKNKQTPRILNLVHGGNLKLEIFIVLDMLLDLSNKYNEQIPDDVLWSYYSHRIKKYKPFLSIDAARFGKIFDKLIDDCLT